MEDNERDQSEKAGEENGIVISPMQINKTPLRRDTVGDAGEFIDSFIHAIESENIYKVMGTYPDKSFLLTGAPGNGKTMAIEALVNEMNQDVHTGLLANLKGMIEPKLLGFKYDIETYGTKYINEGSRIVQLFFDTCFMKANMGYKTLVIFDEAETLFGKRISDQHKEDIKVLETIMKNMQRLHDTDNMYAVMMSNFPEAFDEASIRSGRVDQKYEFKNPTLDERVLAYRHAIERVNERATYKVIRKYDSEHLAELSNNFSHSDITESVNSAVKLRAKEASQEPTSGALHLNIWITGKRIIDSIKRHRKMFIKEERTIGFY